MGLALAAVACAAAVAVAVPPGDGAFGGLSVAPADAQLVVRVRDGRSLRSDPALVPLEGALAELAGSRTLEEGWDRLAETLGLAPDALLDRLFGADAVYVERAATGAAAAEWAIVTRTDPAFHAELIERLKPAAAAGGQAVLEAQRATVAWRPPWLVIGPTGRTGLMTACVSLLERPDAKGSMLALPAAAPLAAQAPAPVEVAWMQDGSGAVGGFGVRMRPRGLTISVRGAAGRWPLRVASGWPADGTLASALARGSILATSGSPWRGAPDPSCPVDAILAEGGMDDAMWSNLGARMALVVGERTLPESGIRVPTLGVAFEVRDARLAERQWDGWAARLAARVAARAGLPAPGSPPRAPRGAVRETDLSPMLVAAFSDHPFARGTDLCMQSIEAAGASWQLVATDCATCARMAEAMRAAGGAASIAVADEVGELGGTMLARHVASWQPAASSFAPSSAEAFARGVALAARLAEAVDRVRWRIRAGANGTIEGEVDVDLSAP
jgi:hypothetical protein